MAHGNAVLGVNVDVADACRNAAEKKGVTIKDLCSEALLSHPDIWEAYKSVIANMGGLTDGLVRPKPVEPITDDYLGG